jgi:predicted DNA binding protein
VIEAVLSVRAPSDLARNVLGRYRATIEVLDSIHSKETGCKSLVTITVDPAFTEDVIQDIETSPAIIAHDLHVNGPGRIKGSVTTRHCFGGCAAAAEGVFLLGVWMESDGRILHRLAASSTDVVRQVVTRMESRNVRVELEKLKTLDEIEGGLTPRQEDVLFTAMELGYFDDPKGVDLKTLAERFQVSISTLSEVIRKAQHKIMTNFFTE